MDLATICKLLVLTIALTSMTMLPVHSQGTTLVSVVLVGMKDNNAVANLMTNEGDTVSLVCHIIGFQENQILSITRVTDTGASESLLWNNSAPSSDTTKHIDFDGYIEFEPGSFLYTMVIHNVTKLDAGKYSCVVFNSEGNRFTPVVNDEADLRVLHLPDPMYPICDSLGQDTSFTRFEGDRVTFKCESEIGDPEVFLDWELSTTRPYLPRPNEVVENGFFKSELIVELELGHSGKMFHCVLTSGLVINYHPKCSIGPYTVQRRPTDPRPPVTEGPVGSSGNVQIRTINTTPSDASAASKTTLTASGTPMGNTSTLGTAAIAGICVIIVLTFCIMLIVAAAYLIKTNKYWSPSDSKSPLSENSPDRNANLDATDSGPTLLGFKKRLSKKASLRPNRHYEPSVDYEYENRMLAKGADFNTIAEGGEPFSTPLSNHRPIPSIKSPSINPIFISEPESDIDDRDNTSPLSQQSDQPFLKSTEKLDSFGFPSPPPTEAQPTEEEESASVHSEESPSKTPEQESQTPRTSSSLSVSGDDLEGEWEPASREETPPEPPVVDPSNPVNLPQDVMDILMDLDLDLFANEVTEDTEL